MPYNIITQDGQKRIHHARTAREALDFALEKRAEHPDLKIVSSEGTVLAIDRLELMARAEASAVLRSTRACGVTGSALTAGMPSVGL